MRILYVCPDDGIPVLGAKGGAAHVRQMVDALARAGHRVVLAAPVGVKSPGDVPAAVQAEFLQITPGAASLEAAAGLKAFVARAQAEGPAARDLRRILYDTELASALLARFSDEPPDLIYCRAALFSTAALALARATARPLLVELNAPLAAEQAMYRRSGLSDLAVEAERALLTGADAVLAVSSVLSEHVVRLGVARERVHVLPNAIDPERFRPAAPDTSLRRRLGLGPGPVLGFVGGLKRWHGVEALPDLLARLTPHQPDLQLLVVGDGPMREALVHRLDVLGLAGRTVLAGAVAHEAIPDHIRLLDVALAPYPCLEHDFYFSPLKLFEYMGCGTAVVAPRSGQIAEVVEDGRNGLLYPPGDFDALAAACERVLRDQNLRRRLGHAAADRVHAHYTWRLNAERVTALAVQVGERRLAA